MFEEWYNIPSKSTSNKQKKIFFGNGAESGFVSQRYGSADPDPYQNVTDPEHFSSERQRDMASWTISSDLVF